jgi:hypothetical protein
VLLITAGCAGVGGRSVRAFVDDQSLTAKVKLKLAALKPSTLARINVDVYDGTVYLSGTVPTPELKTQAEAITAGLEGVDLVVNNLQVKRLALSAGESAPSPPMVTGEPPRVLSERLRGVARFDGGLPAGPYRAHDGDGRVVATVYIVSMVDLAQMGLDGLTPSLPIDHVSVYSMDGGLDVPEPHYQLVLWHVSRAEAAAFR